MNRTWAVLLALLLASVTVASAQPGSNAPGADCAGDCRPCDPPRPPPRAGASNNHTRGPGEGDNATTAPHNETQDTHGDGNASRPSQPAPRPNDTRPRPGDSPPPRDTRPCCPPLRENAPPCPRPIQVAHQHIEFAWMGDVGLKNYTVSDVRVLDYMQWHLPGPTQHRDMGRVTEVRADGARIQIHDEPNGLIAFHSKEGSVTLDFAAAEKIQKFEHSARILMAGGQNVLLRFDQANWISDDVVEIYGFGGIHLPPPPQARGPVQQGLQDAVADRRLGAEVAIRGPRAQEDAVNVLSYDDLQVRVAQPNGPMTPENPLEIRVEANLTEGRTVALNLDPSLLPSLKSELVLRYFNEQDDGTRTEVVFRQASNLQDILDPTDDGGQPEYWVTRDADGLHVLVSVPHWSIHVFTVGGIAILEPNIMVGLVAGLAATGLAGVAMFARRRDA